MSQTRPNLPRPQSVAAVTAVAMPAVLPAVAGGEPVFPQRLPYARHSLSRADIDAVVSTLRSPFITQGPNVARFESAFARRVGASYAVAFSSGTAALHAACSAAGLQPEDEVIVPTNTFVATAAAPAYLGARPVFVDTDPRTGCMSVPAVRAAITPQTRAIMPVHFAGHPARMRELRELARQVGAVVIEDACHAFGARVQRPEHQEIVGACTGEASMACFSFHPAKHITCAEGGIVTTRSEIFAEHLRAFRQHGVQRSEALSAAHGPWYYEISELGFNYRMNELQAALGLSQLTRSEAFLERRRIIAERYHSELRRIVGLELPRPLEGFNSAWHLYVVRIQPERFTVGRREIVEALHAEGVGVQVHYIPLHRQPVFQDDERCHPSRFPNAEDFYARCFSLPIFPSMSDNDVAGVILAVHRVLEWFRR